MVDQQGIPSVAEITAQYDKIGDITANLLGENIHLGYWRDDADQSSVQEATDRVSDMVFDRIKVSVGDRVLDVGCGNGRPAARLAGSTRAEVVGITNSEHHLRQARARAKPAAGQVSFEFADAMEMPFHDETFDAAMAIESITLMPDPAAAIREIARVLRPGGRIGIASIVLTGTVQGRDFEFIERVRDVLTRPHFETPDGYRKMLKAAGLRLESLDDIGPHVYKRSVAAMLPANPATLEREYKPLGLPPEQLKEVTSVLHEFAEFPLSGYALIAAVKPERARPLG
jgi:SAM-dependent methyltransferase